VDGGLEMIDIANTWFYPTLFGLLILFVILTFIFLLTSRKKQKVEEPTLDLELLLNSLGGSSNIERVSMEHQRLKVIINDLKRIDQLLLKQLEIPAFLKGRELTLLIKQHTKEVLSYLNERRKEVN
jgi:phosphotransferase system IIB component